MIDIDYLQNWGKPINNTNKFRKGKRETRKDVDNQKTRSLKAKSTYSVILIYEITSHRDPSRSRLEIDWAINNRVGEGGGEGGRLALTIVHPGDFAPRCEKKEETSR